jgi:hypothetical protein
MIYCDQESTTLFQLMRLAAFTIGKLPVSCIDTGTYKYRHCVKLDCKSKYVFGAYRYLLYTVYRSLPVLQSRFGVRQLQCCGSESESEIIECFG